ncbi:multidrug effflux MFS transporter [Candidatus Marinarcus aquaticus]|uniref:Bcr/CflA family drug resistance efflux transporter n=1 Tax=Candidatus Marinarcus aquaticus TaxID=2044504 RepID=A0A4Q0XQW7_9BACT|nr:multidrug effflux MFS transporter [Candidatus Marinarcus aquaticus]RXJ58179.1 Bcr/CflA family drug resistance efflux transporter [Candidatus Marinarcus aquaticus]
MKKSINHIYLIILLSILSAVAPMSIDTYIPSIPNMAQDFAVGIEKVELTLSIFLIGFALGQIFGGVVSDRIGRRKSSLIGLLGFAFFSFIIVFSTNIYELWLYRFIEAFFGGLIVVNANAVVRDIFHGQEAAKIFSLIGSIRSIAPLVAPAIGAFIIHFFPWEGIFIFLGLYALIVALMIYKDLQESYTYVKTKALESYKIVFKNRNAMLIMLVLGLGFSGMFILIAKSSFIYIEYYGISTDMFPFFFGFSIVVLMVMIQFNIKLLKQYTARTLVQFALSIQLILAACFIAVSHDISLPLAMFFISLYMGLTGFIYGNCTALAMEDFSKNAGVASSVIGVVQFGIGALISAVVLLFHTPTLTPIAISIFLISLIGLFLLHFYKK